MKPQPQTTPRKLRARDVIRLYPIGQSTLWHYVKLGKIKAIKITDGVTCFDADELEAFFNGKAMQ